jgi:uncharacterized protein (TIGR03435 family)
MKLALFFTLLALPCMAQPAFEVATVKPNPQGIASQGQWSLPSIGKFTASSVTMTLLLQLAYGIDKSQIANQPGWCETDLFDVNARPEAGIKLSREELKPRLQTLLQQRFHLQAHFETRQLKGYALTIAKGGPRLTPTKADTTPGWRTNVSPGSVAGKNWTMAYLAMQLIPAAGMPVVDRTGLTGSYDIAFVYAADPEKDASRPSLFTAIRDTLGLQLDPQKVPVETLIIDHLDRTPTDN